ncbi:MAG: hypothetical protein ABS943_00335 [Pantoea agglomerans]
MKIVFEEILESDYFRMVLLADKKGKESSQTITIGKDNKRAKNEFSNISYTSLIEFDKPITITIHQQKHELLADNTKNLISLIRLINERNGNANIKIQVISDHYNYYYKQFYSAIYTDNTLFNSLRINIRKVAFLIILKKYFGYKLAHVISVFYSRLRRLIRF